MAYPPIPVSAASVHGAQGARSANTAWQARSRAAVWHPCTQNARLDAMPPLPIARGQGSWLIDFDGKRYLDGTSSWWSTCSVTPIHSNTINHLDNGSYDNFLIC